MNYYEILGETVVRDLTGQSSIGINEEAAKVVDATSDVIRKGQAAYEAAQKASQPSTALVPSYHGQSVGEPTFFTKIYGGVPGWGWLALGGIGFLIFSSWLDGKIKNGRR